MQGSHSQAFLINKASYLAEALDGLLGHSLELPEGLQPEEVRLVLVDFIKAISRIQGVIEALPKTG